MRDLVIIAGEIPHQVDADAPTFAPNPMGPPVRYLVDGAFEPLETVEPSPEQAMAVGVAAALSGQGVALDIVSLGKPGAHLKSNWDVAHKGRLFVKSSRMLQRILQAGTHRVAGVLWVARPHPEGRKEDYSLRFETLIEKLRLAIGAPELPVCAMTVTSPGDEESQASYTSDVTLTNYADVSRPDIQIPNLIACGMSLARELYSTEHNRPSAFRRNIRWLWKGSMYQAWLSVPANADPDDPHYVVAFPHMMGATADGFDTPGFGQTALERRGIKTVVIRSRQSNWFQDDEILKLGHVVRKALPDNARVTTYGASMGAYGALLLSSILGAERVIAVAPQYSLDQDVVPFERRWQVHRDRIGGFRHTLHDMIAPDARKLILYDNLDKDRLHVALINPDDTFQLFRFPSASHQILRYLKETGCLSDFLTLLGDPDMEFAPTHARARAGRHHSPIYWLGIFRHFKTHRQDCAANALGHCVTIEGPKHKFLKRLKKLDPKWHFQE